MHLTRPTKGIIMSDLAEDQKQPKKGIFQLSVNNILSTILNQLDDEQLLYTTKEAEHYFYFKWDKNQGIEWNIYKFSDSLELFKRACKRLEEHRYGSYCTDENIRDKYLMPKIKAFTSILSANINKK